MSSKCEYCGARNLFSCHLPSPCVNPKSVHYQSVSSPEEWDNLEKDPLGTPQHSPGAKLDSGKTRIALVLSGFADAFEAVSKVGTDGAVTYSEMGFLDVPEGGKRYLDAALRHLLKHLQGVEIDPKTGHLHLSHFAWNALAVLQFHINGDSGYHQEENKKDGA